MEIAVVVAFIVVEITVGSAFVVVVVVVVVVIVLIVLVFVMVVGCSGCVQCWWSAFFLSSPSSS